MIVPDQFIPLVFATADLLARLKLEHAFGGAIANNYWGVVRATQDVDVLVLLPAIRFQEFAAALDEAGYSMLTDEGRRVPVDVPRMRESERSRRLFAVYRDGLKLEVFLPFLPIQNEILRRAVRLDFEGRPIPVTTAEDLIVLKLIFHRPKDLQDVRGILATQGKRLDFAYMRKWAAQVLEDAAAAELEQWIAEYVGS